MPRYDYKCPHCERVGEYTYTNLMKKPPFCEVCGHEMERLPPTGVGFSIKGFNAANGYAKDK